MSNETTIRNRTRFGRLDLSFAYPDVRTTAYEMQARGEMRVVHENGRVLVERAPSRDSE